MVNGPNDEFLPCFAPDGSALYIDRGDNSTYTYTQWKAPILPIVDFNADSKVDAADLLALVLNLGTNQTLYDIGPFAWGDGKVDIEDVKVFIAEWEKQNPPAQP
jgi:hypothetical protein